MNIKKTMLTSLTSNYKELLEIKEEIKNITLMPKRSIQQNNKIKELLLDYNIDKSLFIAISKTRDKSIGKIYRTLKNYINNNISINEIRVKPIVIDLVPDVIINYLLDFGNDDEDQSWSFSDDLHTNSEDSDSDDNVNWTWRDNQIAGFQNAIDSNFETGIHSQATGAGKSLIALKIVWEYHKLNPTANIIWMCERKDIPLKLFLKINDKGKVMFHEKNFKKWKKRDIIDMDAFHVVEHVYKKDKNWINKINNYTNSKPLFLIINRAFITTKSLTVGKKKKYEDIEKKFALMILDECHSATSTETHRFLKYAQNNWNTKIQGFSATPYRNGRIKRNNQLISNYDLLLNVFHKKGNAKRLNIISWFNIREAIEKGVILEPVFHWYQIDKYIKCNSDDTDDSDINHKIESRNRSSNDPIRYETSESFNEKEIASVMSVLNNIVGRSHFKKILVWCRMKSIADEWYILFDRYKKDYYHLKNIKSFIDHGDIKESDKEYDTFYKIERNAIIFCAQKHREGSDIPNLEIGLFLDKVKNRGEVVFIQCIGRLLRIDPLNKKKNGHIIDCVNIDESDEYKMKNIIKKIISYYLRLYERTKPDIINSDNKFDTYCHILDNLQVLPDKQQVNILLKNDKKITIDMKQIISIKSVEWKTFMPQFEQVMKDTFVFTEKEEYLLFQKKVNDLGIKNKQEYFNVALNTEGLYYINDIYKQVIDPSIEFSNYFKGWYDFLKVDTSKFMQSKNEWTQFCKKYRISSKIKYEKMLQHHECLPEHPEELYESFTNLASELGGFKKKVPRRKN